MFLHDIEVLLLSAGKALGAALGVKGGLKPTWRQPAEDQNDDKPPKYVVNELFLKHRKRAYNEIQDAPKVLRGVTGDELATACEKGFGPFWTELSSIIRTGRLPDGGAE